jgi:glycosyltransferase involved in cell wall biosynthesis
VSDVNPFPLVSVIVPVRNEESSIRRVIEQLLVQDQPPHEIILADGGSTDTTKEIIRTFIAAEYAVRLIEDANAYPGRARNLAMAAAKTEWVAMTDAGTVIGQEWLENLVCATKSHPEAVVVFGSYQPILDTYFRECLALAFVPPAKLVDGLAYRGPTTASMMIRRETWESLGRFPEHLRACEDLQFFARIEEANLPTAIAPGAVVSWNIPSGLGATFHRFRLYSRHTLVAGMGRSWQLAVARMYAGAAVLIALAVLHHPAWLFLLAIIGIVRVHRTIRRNRPWLTLRHRVGPGTYAMVGFLLMWIDFAAFIGSLEYIFRSSQRLPPKPKAS